MKKTKAMNCEHHFIYKGLVYKVSSHPLGGTSAKRRTYYESYFCDKCLERKHIQVAHKDTTYEKVAFGATPMGL